MEVCEVKWCACHTYPTLKHGDDPRPFQVTLIEDKPKDGGGTEQWVWMCRVEGVKVA